VKISAFGFYFQCAEVFDVKLGGVVKVPRHSDRLEWTFLIKYQTKKTPVCRKTGLDEVGT